MSYRRKRSSSQSQKVDNHSRQINNHLRAVVDGVGDYFNPPVPIPVQVQTQSPTNDRLDRLIQLMEQQQQGWFYKLKHRPFAGFIMFITGIVLVVGCAYLYHVAVLQGCKYAEEQLSDAIYRHDYGSMELYSQQVNRLCSLNNKMRIAAFDHFGQFIDSFSPSGLIQQAFKGAFGWIPI